MLTLVLCPDDNERPFSDISLAPPSATPPPVLVGGAVFSPGNNENPFSDIPPPLPPLVVVTGVADDCNDKPFKATPPPAKIDDVLKLDKRLTDPVEPVDEVEPSLEPPQAMHLIASGLLET